eukprot:842437-Prymnesium_polylepis.1
MCRRTHESRTSAKSDGSYCRVAALKAPAARAKHAHVGGKATRARTTGQVWRGLVSAGPIGGSTAPAEAPSSSSTAGTESATAQSGAARRRVRGAGGPRSAGLQRRMRSRGRCWLACGAPASERDVCGHTP